MGLIGTITKTVGRLRKQSPPSNAPQSWKARARRPEPIENGGRVRRWAAADDNRLSSAHWSDVTGGSINDDLQTRLETLRCRTEYEAANNPAIEGMLLTYACDAIGEHGPTLQVQTKSKRLNDRLEAAWRDWWSNPDINGRLSGTDILRMWIRQLFTAGEFGGQLVNESTGDVRTRIHPFHPRRIQSPLGAIAGGDGWNLGVKTNKTGRPMAYGISDDGGFLGEIREIPASGIVHEFQVIEPGQVRGVPWLAPCLPTIAELRDYDQAVLDAARLAAEHAGVLWTNHADASYVEVNETTYIEPGMIKMMPPGWQMTQMKSEQPTTGYEVFRNERFRDIGRVVGMPLMMFRLDSSDHNYSSARLDAQVYHRGIRAMQAWVTRRVLNRLVRLIALEAFAAGVIPAPLPADASVLVWTWPQFPHVDPKKEAEALMVLMTAGVFSPQDALSHFGRDLESYLASLKRARELYEEAGLAFPSFIGGAAPTADTPDNTDDEGDDDATEDTDATDDATDDDEARTWSRRHVTSNGTHN